MRTLTLLFSVCSWLCLALNAQQPAATTTPTSSTCLECHAEEGPASATSHQHPLQGSVHKELSCIDCHEGYDPDAQPHRKGLSKVDCSSCHDNLGKSHRFHPALAQDPITTSPSTNCVGCHGSHAIKDRRDPGYPFSKTTAANSCGRCHEKALQAFEASDHATKNTGLSPSPSCVTCHSKAIVAEAGQAPSAAHKLAQIQLCESCHVKSREVAQRTTMGASFVSSFEQSVHGTALLAGKADAPGCADCHGNHDTKQASEAGSSVGHSQIAATCAKCHPAHAEAYGTSVHAAALARGVSDAPTCTDCHGEHDIKSRHDPASSIHAKNLSQQVCASCHASVKLSRKYGLAADRFATFTDSYHGLAVRGGAVEVVNCASCHGAHAIKSHKDPTSSIHKDNLVQTCGKCHQGASSGFTIGNVHASESQKDTEPVLYWVSTLYVSLIFAVIGGMFLHNLLDFIKKIRRKLLIQKGIIVEHVIEHRLYVRMTLHERLQHATLVISFSILVLTGFMLRYPEAWWVTAIQNLSANAFEWRSLVHRVAGVIMLLAGLWHLWYLCLTRPGRHLLIDLLPRWRDLTDPVKVLRYNLGLSPTKPSFGRFCYIEKAEYWAMMWGTLLMGATGAILWFDDTSMSLITKLGFDVARTIHFYEAVLATLAIIFWHFYFVIFNPDVYPMNLAWLTGRMSEREMQEEHPEQLRKIKEEEARALSTPPKPLVETPEEEPPTQDEPSP